MVRKKWAEETFFRRVSNLNRIEGSFLEGTPLKVVIFLIVVVLGLSAFVLTPIMPFLALIGVAMLLPIERRARTSLMIIGCLSIGLGAALSTADLPSSEIATQKLLGLLFH